MSILGMGYCHMHDRLCNVQTLRDQMRELINAEASAKRALEAETAKYARKAAQQLQQVRICLMALLRVVQ